jgi:hypothetical protein
MEPRQNYLFVTASGQVEGLQEIKGHTAEAFRAALKNGLAKILCDGRDITGGLSITERFEYGNFLAEETLRLIIDENAPKLSLAIVIVEPLLHPERFGEVVARNRGVAYLTTDSLDEALEWLGEKVSDNEQ